ncbi:tRNA (adenosine(37)-N6)-dimethylallyltransferase MiaA [Rhodopirellula sp. MGV]|nr:tRNA (adenosine(37)-N6)-dimethylallyltransferase MiaA [Rhodopirellula sp. MGV]PNY38831.1 tRNA (adenosine(37)-N6)-dimethylallyltransferase MiaA [Rhodopirellula baltica]
MPDSIVSTYPSLIDKTIVLTGATASGKSSLAIELAKRLGGEILSLDSIAVYRQMEIGTAKPTPEDRQQVPHHLLDLADPDEDFSVACYLDAAHQCVQEILDRSAVPIFVGGTPMFLKAILRGFDPGPPPDWAFREAVEKDVERFGVEPLRTRLQQVDPLSASRIAPNDVRRMIRALEVAKATGFPLSHRQVQFDQQTHADACKVFAIQHPRAQLHQRINQRVNEMFRIGLVDEVRRLLSDHGELSRTAAQAVGYREVIEWIRGGESTPIETVIEEVAAHTRQLARRQETWFRSFSEITTVQVADFEGFDAILEWLVERVSG